MNGWQYGILLTVNLFQLGALFNISDYTKANLYRGRR